MLAIQCARLFWAAFAPLGPVGDWRNAPTLVSVGAGPLASFDPFFRLSTPAISVVTNLPLKLYGIRLDEASGRGSAIIAGDDGVQQSYAVGDEVLPGIRLKAVARDSVTIDRGGTAEQLYLDQSTPATVAQPSGPAPAPLVPVVVQPLGPAALQAGIAFAPRLEKGVVTGFVVAPKGSGDAFRAAGLQPGDILTQLNGVGLHSAEEAMSAVSQLPPGAPVTLTVERAGSVIILNAGAPR